MEVRVDFCGLQDPLSRELTEEVIIEFLCDLQRVTCIRILGSFEHHGIFEDKYATRLHRVVQICENLDCIRTMFNNIHHYDGIVLSRKRHLGPDIE